MEPDQLGDYTPDAPANEGPASQEAVENSVNAAAAEGGGIGPPAPSDTTSRQTRRGIRVFYQKHKKGGLVAGGILGVIALSLVGFILLLPFKAIHFLKTLEQKTFAPASDTVNARSEKLLDKYIEKKLIAKGATDWGVNHTSPIVTGNVLNDLMKTWAASNFEEDLSKKGISFQRLASGRYRVLQNGVQIDDNGLNGPNNTVTVENMTNNQFRTFIKQTTSDETKRFQIIKRRNLRFALYQRYGVQRWWFFEKPLQAVQDKRIAIKRSIQRQLNNRIIRPMSGKLADYFDCLINDSCAKINDNKQVDQIAADSVTKAADEAADKAGANATADAVEKEVQTEVTDQSLKSLTSTAGNLASFSYETLQYANKINNAVKPGGKLEQILKARSYLGYATFFAANATAIHQIIAGEAVNGPTSGPGANPTGSQALAPPSSPTRIGNFFSNARSFVAAAAPINLNYTNVDAYNEQLGNPAVSRVYEKFYVGADNSKLSPKKCDGTNLPTSQLVCPSQKVVPPQAADIRNMPFMGVISVMSDAYDKLQQATLGLGKKIQDALQWVLDNTGITSAIQGIVSGVLQATGGQDLLNKATSAAMGYVFGPGVNAQATNGDWFDNMQAGASVSASQTMQSLGGKTLSPQEQQAWNNHFQDEQLAKENGWHGVAYKVAAIDSPTSLVGRLIDWSPNSIAEVPSKMAGFIASVLNPNQLLAGAITVGNAVTPGVHTAFAAPSAYQDPFGIEQYGYAVNDPHLTQDAEVTAAQCEPGSASRQAIDLAYQQAVDAHINDPEHHPTIDATDWCLLEDATINANGAIFTPASVDNAGLQAAINAAGGGAGTAAPSAGGGVQLVSGTRAELNQRLLSNPLVTFAHASARGDITSGTAQDALVQFLVTMVDTLKLPITITAIDSDHPGCPGGSSNHCRGWAVDIGQTSAIQAQNNATISQWVFQNKDSLHINELIHSPMPSGVYDLKNGTPCPTPISGGGFRCDNGKTYPGSTIADHQNHVHIAVMGATSN